MRERVRNAGTLVAMPSAPVRGPRPAQWSMAALQALDNDQFAILCAQLWRWRGLRVGTELRNGAALCLQLRRGPGRQGPLQALVWCELRTGDGLGAGALRELFGLMHHRGCERGVVMSRGDFDLAARDFARGKAMELKGALTLSLEIEALTEGQRTKLLDIVFDGDEPALAV